MGSVSLLIVGSDGGALRRHPYWQAGLSVAPNFARSVQIAHATAANAWIARIGADITPVVPAALAFLGVRWGHLHAFLAGGRFADRGLGSDQHELQVVVQAGQQRMAVAGR